MPRIAADSFATGFPPALACDGDLATVWQTELSDASPAYPHELTIDLGSAQYLEGLLYVPRQDSDIGRVSEYEVRVSLDGRTYGKAISSGRWDNDPSYKYAPLPGARAQFIQLRGLREVAARPVMSAAEIVIETLNPRPSSH